MSSSILVNVLGKDRVILQLYHVHSEGQEEIVHKLCCNRSGGEMGKDVYWHSCRVNEAMLDSFCSSNRSTQSCVHSTVSKASKAYLIEGEVRILKATFCNDRNRQ